MAQGTALMAHQRLTPSPVVSAVFASPTLSSLSSLSPTAPGVASAAGAMTTSRAFCGAFSTRAPVSALMTTVAGHTGLFSMPKRAPTVSTPRTTRSFVMPVEGARITSTFGARRHPIRRVSHRHDGVDFAALVGTPVLAAADGEVTFIGYQGRGFGRYIVIAHRYDSETLYAHLSATARGLRVGDTVSAGDEIGAIGRTGMATGPHLHFELRRNGNPVDPSPLLSRGSIREVGAGVPNHAPPQVDACQRVLDAMPSWRPTTPSARIGGVRWHVAPM